MSFYSLLFIKWERKYSDGNRKATQQHNPHKTFRLKLNTKAASGLRVTTLSFVCLDWTTTLISVK